MTLFASPATLADNHMLNGMEVIATLQFAG